MTLGLPRRVGTLACPRRARVSDPSVNRRTPFVRMRRLAALIMLLGAATAALGVVAVVGVERIDLPPAHVRAIAAALPVAVLVLGLALLLVGAIVARRALREGEGAGSGAERSAGTPGIGARQQPDAVERPKSRDRVI